MHGKYALLIACALGFLVSSQPAKAEVSYPWCAQYSGRDGGRNCGFVTWEQCMATVRGAGGHCERNAMFVPHVPGGEYGVLRRPRW